MHGKPPVKKQHKREREERGKRPPRDGKRERDKLRGQVAAAWSNRSARND